MKRTLFLAVLLLSGGLQANQVIEENALNPINNDADASTSHGSPVSPATNEFTAQIPLIELVDHRNQTIQLNPFFNDDKDIVFAFFFSHCVSVCTTITENLKSLQSDLPAGTKIAMITIDPDTDTPELLAAYANKFGLVSSDWYLLTGESGVIVDLQKDFEAFRGNKMNHNTSLFVKRSHSPLITEFKRNFSAIPQFLESS